MRTVTLDVGGMLSMLDHQGAEKQLCERKHGLEQRDR
jgi:hypothetical protein